MNDWNKMIDNNPSLKMEYQIGVVYFMSEDLRQEAEKSTDEIALYFYFSRDSILDMARTVDPL